MAAPRDTGSSSLRPGRVGLFLGVPPGAGGMFQYAQSVLEALGHVDPARFDVTVAYDSALWAPILSRLGMQGVALRHARLGRRLADAAMAARVPGHWCRRLQPMLNPLVRELRGLRCDTWLFPAQESLAYQIPGTCIGTIHDLMHRYEPTFPEVSQGHRFAIREHRFASIARDCQAVLVDSEVGRRQVVESYGVPAGKIFPLPYVAPSYITTATERPDFGDHYRLPSKFLFYPAQFWLHKNHLRLVDALKLCLPAHPDMALVLAGAPTQAFDQVRRHAHALGLHDRVRFVGYVPDADLRGFYGRARALVMPTFFGPTNIPPLEACAAGCPAVVSGIYGMPEQLGDAALYFDPRSVCDIADKIARVWSDDALAQELARKGQERAARHGQLAFDARLAAILEQVVPPAVRTPDAGVQVAARSATRAR